MSNDLIRLAMERAVAAGAALDGHVVRAMLTGRGDVEPLKGGSHYRLLPNGPAEPVSKDEAKHRATLGGGELIHKLVADLQRAPDVAYCGISAKHRKAGGHRIKLTVDLYGMPVKVEAQS